MSSEASANMSARKSDLIMGLIGFAGAVIGVQILGCKIYDLVWGLWASSLIFGWAIIVVAILAPAAYVERDGRAPFTPGGGFLLVYHIAHFGFVHYIYGTLINWCFPMGGEWINPPITSIFISAIMGSWLLIVTTFISRFSDLPLKGAEITRMGKKCQENSDSTVNPYASTSRMHALVVTMSVLKSMEINLDENVKYIVLMVYFFPWAAVFMGKRKEIVAQ